MTKNPNQRSAETAKNRKHPSGESNPEPQQTWLILYHWATETSEITSQFVWNFIRSASTSQHQHHHLGPEVPIKNVLWHEGAVPFQEPLYWHWTSACPTRTKPVLQLKVVTDPVSASDCLILPWAGGIKTGQVAETSNSMLTFWMS